MNDLKLPIEKYVLEVDTKQLSGRNRRLFYEWNRLKDYANQKDTISIFITDLNTEGLPVGYLVIYHIYSICSVENMERLDETGALNPPVFASDFRLKIQIPVNYPCIDAPISFCFQIEDKEGNSIPHPWHPNIRYFGEFAGNVCLNVPDSYTDLFWCVDRIALYLRYELYHAIQEPPYPEDMKVARWVRQQGEPNEWIYFEQK